MLMEALVHQRRSLILILVKQRQHFVWVCIRMVIIIICLLTEKKIFKFETNNKNVNFQNQF